MNYTQTNDATTSATPSTPTKMVATQTLTGYAIFFADVGNSAPILIGPTSTATLYSCAAGQWYVIQIPPNATTPPGFNPVDLSTWYVQSASASQTYRIAYIA